MKVLVTGGTGFAGSHLTKRLLSRGYEVRVLDSQKGISYDELVAKGARISLGSVTDDALLKEVIEGCDKIFHLAAAFRKVNLRKQVYWDTNVTAMRRLLQIAGDNNVRKVVCCSTQGVHGNVEHPPCDESSPVKPKDYYQYTKYEGEKVAREFMRKGMDITILRPTAMYGPGDPGRFLMLFKRVKTGIFPFFGNGSALYHPVYIDNLVDGFELAAEKPEAQGQEYIIGDEHYYSIKEIVRKIAAIMNVDLKTPHFPFWPIYWMSALVEFAFKPLPMDPPIFRRRVDWFRQNRASKIDKAKRELGYAPAVDLDTGLRRTYEWYRDNGHL